MRVPSDVQGFKALPARSSTRTPSSESRSRTAVCSDSDATGAYVDGYVTDVRLRNLEIANSDGPGVHLEAGSRNNQVRGSGIHDGYGDVTRRAC